MTDSLTVFGTNYTGVTGIKATGTGNGTLTYIRPQGTKSISANGTGIDVTEYAAVDVSVSGGGNDFIVTLTYNSTSEMWEPDKTLSEIAAAYSAGKTIITNADVESYGYYDDGDGAFYYSVVSTQLYYPPGASSVYETGLDETVRLFYVLDSNGVSSDGHDAASESVISKTITENGTYKAWNEDPYPMYAYSTVTVSVSGGQPTLQSKTNITPTTSSQTITPDSGYDGLSSVQINAMPSGTAGTPTATKGTVSNHSVSVTPSVTNTTGYITGSTKTGTAVTVSASELVSGTYTVDSSGTKDVTNYASASVPAGTAGTPSATKGTVSNHSVSVTPSVTNQTGWITGSTKTGTAVTVSASELVSGSETKSANGTYDVTNLASLVVSIPFVTYYTGTSNPSSSQGSNGDIYLKTVS